MREIPQNSEQTLLRSVASGDQAAYEALFTRYWDTVFSTALLLAKSPEVAEDIAQDVFTMVWEKRTELPRIVHFEAWLFVAARNMIYSRLRKLASQENYRQYIKDYLTEESPDTAEFRELERMIQGAIRSLPSQQQKAFRLSRFEGMRHEEIAATMGVSRVTIKSYIVQAIASLRKALANYPSGITLLLMLHDFL